jgi:hypothetical protein
LVPTAVVIGKGTCHPLHERFPGVVHRHRGVSTATARGLILGCMGRDDLPRLPGGGPVAGLSAALERWAQRAELRHLDDDQDGESADKVELPRAEHE